MSKLHSREPFAKVPPDTLSDEQLLSLLLDYCETDTAEKSTHLLRYFDNLANLLDAKTDELDATKELSDKGISLIRLVAELQRRYLFIRSRTETRLQDREAIAKYLAPLFSGATTEQVYLLCMDSSYRVLGCSCVSEGDIDSAQIFLRTLVRDALLKKASNVVLSHNHPAGQRYPSPEDIQTTQALQDLLRPLDIRLFDHIIFTNSGHCSLVECGYIHV